MRRKLRDCLEELEPADESTTARLAVQFEEVAREERRTPRTPDEYADDLWQLSRIRGEAIRRVHQLGK